MSSVLELAKLSNDCIHTGDKHGIGESQVTEYIQENNDLKTLILPQKEIGVLLELTKNKKESK